MLELILNPSLGESGDTQEQATTLVSSLPTSLPTDGSTISATAYSELVYSQAVAAVTAQAQQQFQGGQLLTTAPVLTPVTPKQENGEGGAHQQQKQQGSGGKGINW